jgi:ABC-type branched-subunit amino acid transport system ATPase component
MGDRDRSLPSIPADAPVVLSVRDVTVRYGGVVAVNGVSFEARRGSILGLIGPNGAGKTTLIDAVSGFAPSTGSVVLGDRTIDGLRPHERVRAGLGRTFQAIELYDDLSVEENVIVGLTAHTGRKDAAGDTVLAETFDLLGLTEVRDRPAGELSQGQRQLVSIARALAGRPDVLLLDEPAGGLGHEEVERLAGTILGLRDDLRLTVVLVEHNMKLVMKASDQVHVLDFGRTIATGSPAEIQRDAAVVSAYLGRAGAGVPG